MGTLATFTFRVACLRAVGAYDPPIVSGHSLDLLDRGLDIAHDVCGPTRWRRHSSWMRAPAP